MSEKSNVAGAANLAAYLARKEPTPDVRGETENFEAQLLNDLGAEPTVSQRALVTSASTSYAVLLIARNRLLRTCRWVRGTDTLAAQISSAQGQLSRALRALGTTPQDAAEDSDPANMSPEARREWARKYVEDTLAKDRSETP